MKHIISVIGLGYVGLPVAIEFSKYFETIGYDINQQRIKQLNLNNDVNEEISSKLIKQSKKLIFTSNSKKLRKCNTHIITVPTPINKKNKPDLKHIFYACKQVGKILKKNDFVIFESTVYPGLTEEKCIPTSG